MKPLTPRARAVLADFRDEETLDPASEERLLAALHVRLAAAPVAPSPPAAAAPGAAALGPAVAKVILGVVLAGVPAAWFLGTGRPGAQAPAASAERRAVAEPPARQVTSAIRAPDPFAAPSPRIARNTDRPVPLAPLEGSGPHAVGSTKIAAPNPRTTRSVLPTRPPRVAEADGGRTSTTSVVGSAEPPAAPAASLARAAEPPPVLAASVARAAEPPPAPAAERRAEPRPLGSAPQLPVVDDEMRRLGDAYALLKAGKASQALAALDELRRVHPNGRLRESREAARILALCSAGRRTEARAAADLFVKAHPASPVTKRVMGSCR